MNNPIKSDNYNYIKLIVSFIHDSQLYKVTEKSILTLCLPNVVCGSLTPIRNGSNESGQVSVACSIFQFFKHAVIYCLLCITKHEILPKTHMNYLLVLCLFLLLPETNL